MIDIWQAILYLMAVLTFLTFWHLLLLLDYLCFTSSFDLNVTVIVNPHPREDLVLRVIPVLLKNNITSGNKDIIQAMNDINLHLQACPPICLFTLAVSWSRQGLSKPT